MSSYVAVEQPIMYQVSPIFVIYCPQQLTTNWLLWTINNDELTQMHVGMIYHVICDHKMDTCLCVRAYILMWDPYLVRHETQLESIQRRAVQFIANLRVVESVTATREKLGLALLSNRRKSAKIVLLLKIFSSSIHQFLMYQFDAVVSNIRSHITRSVAHNDPRAFAVSNALYPNSFLPRTSRELRGDC